MWQNHVRAMTNCPIIECTVKKNYQNKYMQNKLLQESLCRISQYDENKTRYVGARANSI